jgi:hypothetical protein
MTFAYAHFMTMSHVLSLVNQTAKKERLTDATGRSDSPSLFQEEADQ